MVEALSDAGYEVDEAETGDLATKLLDEDGYRLVVTDLNMPGRLNGVDVAAYAHQHEPDLPFVFVTGRPDILARLQRAGTPSAVLTKPFPLADLLETVNDLLNLSDVALRR
jgi:CheY-like chemotaxis protein